MLDHPLALLVVLLQLTQELRMELHLLVSELLVVLLKEVQLAVMYP
jgi:hypothetical protein